MADALRLLLRPFGGGRRPEAEKPLRAELLSIERLEERARALAELSERQLLDLFRQSQPAWTSPEGGYGAL